MSFLNLPLDAFQIYFDMTLPKYKELSSTEKGVVLSLAKHYPSRFKYNTVLENVLKIKPVTKTTTPTISEKPKGIRRRMRRQINMKKKTLTE